MTRDETLTAEEVEGKNIECLGYAKSQDIQIEIGAEQIRALQKQNGELTDKVRELEAQIEKMKSDVKEEIGFAKNFDELHTYNVLNNLLNRWEIKEK